MPTDLNKRFRERILKAVNCHFRFKAKIKRFKGFKAKIDRFVVK